MLLMLSGHVQHAHDVSVCLYMQADIGAGDMIYGVEGVEPQRRQQLIDLLDIDLSWRLNRVSDGQRRRVQICMGLLKPYKVQCLTQHCTSSDADQRLPGYTLSSAYPCNHAVAEQVDNA